jgi:hypothetical protein
MEFEEEEGALVFALGLVFEGFELSAECSNVRGVVVVLDEFDSLQNKWDIRVDGLFEIKSGSLPEISIPVDIHHPHSTIFTRHQNPIPINILNRIYITRKWLIILIHKRNHPIGRAVGSVLALFEVDFDKVEFAFSVDDEQHVHFGVHVAIKVADCFADLGFGEGFYVVGWADSAHTDVVLVGDGE